MKTSLILISTCTLLLCACKDNTANTIQQTNGFAFYKLADTTIGASKIINTPLDSLVLSSTPFLTEKNITTYYWSTHAFVTNSEIDSQFSTMKKWRGQSSGMPFVVVVNQSRIYLGTFWWPYSSSMSQVPYILVGASLPYRIEYNNIDTTLNKRNDIRIYNALLSAGVLQE